jgi:hypothetical protein
MRENVAYNYAARTSTACALNGIALRFQQFDDAITVVALDFNYAVLYRAAAAAGRLELLAQYGQRIAGKGDAFD